MELSRSELHELKVSLNNMIGSRISYKFQLDENSKRYNMNESYLKMDYELLEKVIKELDAYDE